METFEVILCDSALLSFENGLQLCQCCTATGRWHRVGSHISVLLKKDIFISIHNYILSFL